MNRFVICLMLSMFAAGAGDLSAQTRKGGIASAVQDVRTAKKKIKQTADTTAHTVVKDYNKVRRDFKKTFNRKTFRKQFETFKDTMKSKWDKSKLKEAFGK